MKNLFLVLAVGSVVTISCNKDDDSFNSTDENFMIEASYSNWAEATAGEIAAAKGNADSVQMFGEMMVADHTKAENSLDFPGNQF